ncbi:unnamed protein product [Bubo scandiacus]
MIGNVCTVKSVSVDILNRSRFDENSYIPRLSYKYSIEVLQRISYIDILVCPSPGSSYEYLHGNTVVISNINSRPQPAAELKNMQRFTTMQKPVYIDQVHDSYPPSPFRKRKGHNGFKAVIQHEGLRAKRHWLNKFYQDLEKWVWYGYDSIRKF